MPRTRQTVLSLNEGLAELESLPQAIVAYSRDLGAGEMLPFHHHRRAQLVHASEGVMSITTDFAAYVVPPYQAVWVPGGVRHRINARSAVAMRTLYVEPRVVPDLPQEVCVLRVSPLLRELILVAVGQGPDYKQGAPAARLSRVILDQICAQPVEPLALPMPTDSRLARVTQALIANPADPRDLDQWAEVSGASKRTLGRLFTSQTGMSFRDWRRQCRLLRALELLAAGDAVTSIALELGYENTSAFIAMFRRHLGTTPSRYLHQDVSGMVRPLRAYS